MLILILIIYLLYLSVPNASLRLTEAGKASAEVGHYDNAGREIILMDDMNRRVENALDFVAGADDNDTDDNLPLPNDYEPVYEIKARNSGDKDVILGDGKDLLRFYKSTKFRIMNDWWEKGYDKGKLTCINAKGSSTVDYCLIYEKKS